MKSYAQGLLVGLITGFLLGAAVGTVVVAKAQGWNDPYAQTNQEIWQNQQAEMQRQTLQRLQNQDFERQMHQQFPQNPLYRSPC